MIPSPSSRASSSARRLVARALLTAGTLSALGATLPEEMRWGGPATHLTIAAARPPRPARWLPEGSRERRKLFADDAYPLDVVVSFDAALFHWLESLTGASLGKTIPAHRRDYQRRFGRPVGEEARLLGEFARVRIAHASAPVDGGDGSAVRGLAAMRRTFLVAADREDALAALRRELPQEDVAALGAVLEHFAPRYAEIWQAGARAQRFARDARSDPRARELEALLVRMSRFFGVDVTRGPRPFLVPVPVPGGAGTHAEAHDEALLLEVRTGDGLADQASVIAHENAHFLFGRVAEDRRSAWEEVARRGGERGQRAWGLLHEALPTALGQGVVDRAFRTDGWLADGPWYHRDDVSAYAVAIYPVVRDALEAGRPLDERLVEELVARVP